MGFSGVNGVLNLKLLLEMCVPHVDSLRSHMNSQLFFQQVPERLSLVLPAIYLHRFQALTPLSDLVDMGSVITSFSLLVFFFLFIKSTPLSVYFFRGTCFYGHNNSYRMLLCREVLNSVYGSILFGAGRQEGTSGIKKPLISTRNIFLLLKVEKKWNCSYYFYCKWYFTFVLLL